MVLIVVLLPFWTSVLVRSYAWMVLLGRHGADQRGADRRRPDRCAAAPAEYAFAVHIAMIHILLPYMILPIASVLRQIDRRFATRGGGAGRTAVAGVPARRAAAVIPGVAAGSLLVFVLSLGFYITPALVGGPRDLMLSMLIAQQVDLLNWPYAACLSAALLAVTLLLIAAFQRLPGMRDAASDGHAMIGRARVPRSLDRRADVPGAADSDRRRAVVLFGELPDVSAAWSSASAGIAPISPAANGCASTWLSLGVAGVRGCACRPYSERWPRLDWHDCRPPCVPSWAR